MYLSEVFYTYVITVRKVRERQRHQRLTLTALHPGQVKLLVIREKEGNQSGTDCFQPIVCCYHTVIAKILKIKEKRSSIEP